MKLQLIIEKADNSFWGRVNYASNLVVDSAKTIPSLEKKLKKALTDFHDLKDVVFEHTYDLTVFFEQFSFFNQSKIAELAGLNPGLLRQYASGVKHPSREQANKIQVAIRELANTLKTVKIYA